MNNEQNAVQENKMERALSENIPFRKSVTPSVTLCNSKAKKKKAQNPA